MWAVTLSEVSLFAWYVLTLVFLEGLLSADNAIVLAVMVRHLPPDERKKALRYGIWGALGFRLVAVLLSALLMRFWIFKLVGGLYLVYLSLAHFFFAEHSHDISELSGAPVRKRRGKSFWATVVSVELADIVFSIDSILAAVGMAESLPQRYSNSWKLAIVYIGGALGIITMRYVAGYFIVLLDRFKGLANAAYFLVAWIGVKLIVGGLHSGGVLPWEMSSWLFWSVMALLLLTGFIPSRIKGKDPTIDTELRAELPENGRAGDRAEAESASRDQVGSEPRA